MPKSFKTPVGDEEKNWQERVEHQRLTDKLDDLQDRVRELEITLHGKRSKTGLLAEYERHDQLLGRMYAVIWQDPTGTKGVLHDVDVLMGRKRDRERVTPYKWQFFTAIVAALIAAGTTLLTNWDKILKAMPKDKPDKVSRMIEKAKHQKGKKIYRVRVIKPPTSVSSEETPQNPPQ